MSHLPTFVPEEPNSDGQLPEGIGKSWWQNPEKKEAGQQHDPALSIQV